MKEPKEIEKNEENVKNEAIPEKKEGKTKELIFVEIEEVTQDNIAEVVFFTVNEIIEQYKVTGKDNKNELNTMH